MPAAARITSLSERAVHVDDMTDDTAQAMLRRSATKGEA